MLIGPAGIGASVLSKHNTQISELFRLSQPLRSTLTGADLGFSRTECWCTSRPVQSSTTGKPMSQNSGLMKGKRGVILGVANNRSIAWGIALACHRAGAEIALTFQGDALKKRVEPLAKE